MKIALLADIHANLAALYAVLEDLERWRPDQVIVAGDVVNRGPQSRECLDLILSLQHERGWQLLQGNHEEYMVKFDADLATGQMLRHGPRYEVTRSIAWTYEQVADLVPQLAALPSQLDLMFDEVGQLSVLHGSVLHNRDGLLKTHSDDELRAKIIPEAQIFAVGHTHMPFVRQLDATLVVNVGSVGLPFDGDLRAAYAQLSYDRGGWSATIVRLDYDRAATEHAFATSGMLDSVGPVAEIMLRETRDGNSYLYDFIPRYHERIFAGTITMAAAVREFLDELG
jgi:predicted phosphodiesterase